MSTITIKNNLHNTFVNYSINIIKEKIINYDNNQNVNRYEFIDEKNLHWSIAIHKIFNRIHVKCENNVLIKKNSIFAEGDLYFIDLIDFQNLKLNEIHYDKGKDIWKCKNWDKLNILF